MQNLVVQTSILFASSTFHTTKTTFGQPLTAFAWNIKSIGWLQKCISPGYKLTYAKNQNTNICGQTCPTGFYIKESERICDTCNEACSECFGKQVNKCTACKSGYFFKDNGCYACKDSCNECLAPSEQLCIECQTDAYRVITDDTGEDGKWCTYECPKGRFKEGTTMTCDQCHSSCSSCTGSISD